MDLNNLNKDVTAKKNSRQDIQGLRGLSVCAVALYHMWSSTFKNGYLGVDVFFVISGFLMCSILERQRLTRNIIVEFYFRRLRRILPPYLCTILIVLLFSAVVLHQFEYAQLIGETFPSIFYFSNNPNVHAESYFDVHMSVFFFTHLWSLCVELQFYLVVPFIVYILQFLQNIHPFFSNLLLIYLQAFSYWRQSFGYVNEDSKHMMLDARLWQFLSGFLAFRVHSSNIWGLNLKPIHKCAKF
ncbi:Acyl-transf-3 domain-containing protein [Aphelenchoides bicaudatus]|nr:Acyl-transf-3 domain-containing protein [Aphelenchoides bicaudatus]